MITYLPWPPSNLYLFQDNPVDFEFVLDLINCALQNLPGQEPKKVQLEIQTGMVFLPLY